MAEIGSVWIRVRGIPLHLRSKELYQSIGVVCGGFISSDEGTSLAAVRIKVRSSGTIPDEIPMCYRIWSSQSGFSWK
ncbi:hypothetical protein LINGRAHAP2_LOCUS27996 [Linum grandiflorum]